VVRSAGNASYNFVDPVVRDVVSIGNMGDNVTIRFFTDNPGPWFFHCHIDWHLAAYVILVLHLHLNFHDAYADMPPVALPSYSLKMFLTCRLRT
jgi:hypothetical protein